MKYILINPEVIVDEINGDNGIYGKDGLMTRINFGKAEPELDMVYKVINSCRECTQKETQEADITEAFEYQNYGITPNKTRTQLRKLFDIDKFDKSEDGEGIVYVKYMTSKELSEKTQAEKEAFNERYNELEAKLKKLAQKKYTPEEISKIVNYIVKKYTEDLQQREDIVFEQNSWEAFLQGREPRIGDTMHMGGGKQYYPENLMYVVNEERYIVSTCIMASEEPAVAPDYRMTDKGAVFVDILRKSQDGKEENIARCKKEVSEEYGTSVSCYMGDLYYNISDTKSSLHHNEYYVTDKSRKVDSYNSEPSEKEFLEFSKNMVRPESIDALYDTLISKTRFQFPDNSIQPKKKPENWGVREVGDWPQKRPTHLDFETIMSNKQIVDHMEQVKPEDLIENKLQDKEQIQK